MGGGLPAFRRADRPWAPRPGDQGPGGGGWGGGRRGCRPPSVHVRPSVHACPSVHVLGGAARQEDPFCSPSGSTRPSGSHRPAPGEEGLSWAAARARDVLGCGSSPTPRKGAPLGPVSPGASMSSPAARAGYSLSTERWQREDAGDLRGRTVAPRPLSGTVVKSSIYRRPLGAHGRLPPCHRVCSLRTPVTLDESPPEVTDPSPEEAPFTGPG